MYIEKTEKNYTPIANTFIDSLCQGVAEDENQKEILYSEHTFDYPVFSFQNINGFESIFGEAQGSSGLNCSENEYRMSNIFSGLTSLTTTVM